MKEELKKFDLFLIAVSILFIGLGICLVAMPNGTLLTLIYIISTIILIYGMIVIADYFFYGYETFGFMKGVCSFVIGLLGIVFAPKIISSSVLALLVGAIMLVSGLLKAQNAMDCRRFGVKYWWSYLIYAIILVTLSIVMLANPFEAQSGLLIFMGIAFIVDGVCNLISMFVVKGKMKKAREIAEKDIIDI